jgi:hypothetical protein
MYRECRHRMPTGRHCQSPAMRPSAYCYYHDRLHRYPGRPGPKKPLQLPRLDNRDALLTGLTDVMNAILARKVDTRQAGRLIHGMQVAASSLGKASAREKFKAAEAPPDADPIEHTPVRRAGRKSRDMTYYKSRGVP